MKRANLFLAIILLLTVITESRGQRQAVNNDIIKVDVTKKYSSKKTLILQDFMDVEYIPLETNDNFLNQGVVLDIGKKIILVKNKTQDGDIFVYDRITGKALRKINRRGQGPEEYTLPHEITLDEDNGEMFVNDTPGKKILVYDLYGKFKRNLKHGESWFSGIFNYDRNHLICYDQFNEEIAFVLLSKQDGSITQKIKIPFNNKKSLAHSIKVGEIFNTVTPDPYRTIIPFKGNWMLLELSSDTVYSFLPNYSLRPFIVRTPSVQSMNPEVFLLLKLISDRYYFMETIKNVFDFDTNKGYPKTFLMYDKQEKAFFGYTVYNGDYSIKKEIYMNKLRPVNQEIESCQPLEAYQLVESYKKGELKGKLKEIAAKLDEEDNPVIMLIKHKKPNN
ncbi:hypothetical protein FACS189426_10730 [Bacteroidia bacterium]|nr:hypothetical protein FACS189426_10730 [Bacteroidia bacterium]